MVSRRIPSLGFLLSVCTAVLAGCADQYAGRMAVSGDVKLEGQPLKEGIIRFVALEDQGTESGAGIANGFYTIPRQNGLKPGKYLVQITSGDGQTPTREEDIAGPGSTNIVSVDLIPEDWNVHSKHQIEVTSNGKNKFDFEIPKANPKAKKR